MSAATIIAHAFGEGADLYTTVLNTTSESTAAELRKAYYKRALVYHPDKLSSSLSEQELEDAKLKFQAVSVAYEILSNPDKRKEYDESGELDDGDDNDDFGEGKSGTHMWTDYFRGMFGKVKTSDIDDFEAKYKLSDEERDDVLKYYTMFKGDLNKMLQCVMLGSEIDKSRWVQDFIRPAIQSGTVKDYSEKLGRTLGVVVMEHEIEEIDDEATESDEDDEEPKKRSSKKKQPPKKAKPSAAKKKTLSSKKKSSSSEADLIAQIRGNALTRQERPGFNDLMAGLEERYAGKKKKKTKVSVDPIPDDEEFERIKARLTKKKTRK
jgi:DnaJ family protein C protein 9